MGALIAGIEVGKQVKHPSVITLDVGGTSADIGVAPNGALRMKHLLDTRVGDYDAMMPMADIDTIGAGGGSIAYLDEGGMFRVGPRSAGAVPGPACYQRGGTEPTVTDAMVAMGWFRQQALKESGLVIDPDLARQAIDGGIAEPLAMDTLAAAAGIYRIAANNMVEAIRVNSISKGFDPREFALVAYGGAGAAFVVEAAAQLSIPKVVVPTRPGVGAAAGLLATDTRYEFRRTLWQGLDAADHGRIEAAYEALRDEAMKQLAGSGFSGRQIRIDYLAECRYAGQGYELTVPVPPPPVDDAWVANVVEAFHSVHRQAYLRSFDDKPVMIINVGLAGVGRVPPLAAKEIEPGALDIEKDAVLDIRRVHFVEGNQPVEHETRFVARRALRAGNRIRGPAIIEQADTTTVMPAGCAAEVDRFGNLIIGFDSDGHG